MRSQDLENTYRLNGAIYCNKIERFPHENSLIFDQNIFAFIMDRRSSVDIDTEFDLEFAKFLIGTDS